MDERVETDPLVGRDVVGGRYHIVGVLGRGGMGVVYTALQRPIDRKVALKVIHRELSSNPEIVGRFLEEMRLTAAIEHPHTVRVYDFGDLDGQPFLTTEFLQGRTLATELSQRGAMPQERVCSIVLQIAKALRAAEAHGVVHRDLKPDNVMLLDLPGERDYVKVLDFGIARSLHRTSELRTGTGALLGTPAYMSPEQCEGKRVDGRSDLYALGLVAYELATGTPPFPPNDSIPQMLLAHVTKPPPDVRLAAPTLDESVASLIMQLLEKTPERRPPNAEAVIAALEPFAAAARSSTSTDDAVRASVAAQVAPASGGTVALNAPSGVVDSRPVAGSRRTVVVAGVLLAFAVVGGFVAWRRSQTSPAPSADAVASSLTLAGEPPFPASCVSSDPRVRAAIAQALSSGTPPDRWTNVPANAVERLLIASRASRPGDRDSHVLFERLVAACQGSAEAHASFAKRLSLSGDDAAAEQHLRRAAELAPDHVATAYNLGLVLLKRDRPAESVVTFDRVMAAVPDYANVRLVRGQARLLVGDKRGAAEDLERQVHIHPDAAQAWLLLGQVRAALGDGPGARDATCRASKLGLESARERCAQLSAPRTAAGR